MVALHPQFVHDASDATTAVLVPWEEWKGTAEEADVQATWDHVAHSPCCSIAKAQRLLDYRPRYSSLQAVQEAVEWLIAHQGLLS